MTVRRALVTKNDEAIKEYTNSDRDQIHKRIARCYADNPSVRVQYLSNNTGNLTSFTDTRFRSGAAAQNTTGDFPEVTTYPTEGDTGEPQEINIETYSRMSNTRTNPNVGFVNTYPGHWVAKPVYMEHDNVIREMSMQDIIDTFITPVVGYIESGTTSAFAGGTYFISTSASETNCTQEGVVFEDTVTKLSLYSASSIGAAGTFQSHEDTASTVTYYLHKNDGVLETYRLPLVIDKTSNGRNNPAGLREMTQTEFHQLFCSLIRQQIFNGAGNTLSYNINGAGTTKGSALTNRSMTGVTGDYQQREASANDYRAQEFPDGTIAVKQTFRLKLERT